MKYRKYFWNISTALTALHLCHHSHDASIDIVYTMTAPTNRPSGLRLPRILGCALLASTASVTSFAQSNDALIEKLVQKGIITVDEAQDLKGDSDKDFKAAHGLRTGMPDWVKSFKVNGDFRTRYDGIFQDENNSNVNNTVNPAAIADRTRFRYRLRVGFTAVMADQFEVGFRLGSGEVGSALAASGIGGSIFSQNQTLGSDATAKYIFIDAAYLKWTPCENFQMQAGKMDNLLWVTDAVLDPDYQPEGAQERLSFNLGEKHQWSLTSGQWVIGENYVANPPLATTPALAYNADVYLFLNQMELKSTWSKKISTRLAVGNYAFLNQYALSPSLEAILAGNNGTPTVNVPGTASSSGAQDFNPIISRAEFTYHLDSFPLFEGEFPITLGAEYTVNPGASDADFQGKLYSGAANEAYNLGIQFGSNKKKHNWQISYNFKTLESASLWKGMVDDDFGFNARGGTDVRGHLIRGSFRFYDSMTFGVSYFKTERITNPNGIHAEQDRIFADLMWSF